MELRSIYEISSLSSTEQEIRAGIIFNKDHPVFTGHFPGNPIVPGVVQVQVMKDLLENALGSKIFLNAAKSIKFLSMINPLDAGEVQFEITLVQQSAGNYNIKCVVKTEDKVYMKCSGEVTIIS
jgi:3-hydroxyacyl-[acyl-carrier-protein] dehydratase